MGALQSKIIASETWLVAVFHLQVSAYDKNATCSTNPFTLESASKDTLGNIESSMAKSVAELKSVISQQKASPLVNNVDILRDTLNEITKLKLMLQDMEVVFKCLICF